MLLHFVLYSVYFEVFSLPIVFNHIKYCTFLDCCSKLHFCLSNLHVQVARFFFFVLPSPWGTQLSWLRHYATSRKVAGLFPYEVKGFFLQFT
jgi:hypothetical protein